MLWRLCTTVEYVFGSLALNVLDPPASITPCGGRVHPSHDSAA